MQKMHARTLSFVFTALACYLASGCAPGHNTQVTQTGLQYESVKPGAGVAAQRGQTVRIHETMSLADGKEIVNTRVANQPITFTLGADEIIAGIDEAVTGMMVGERRKVIIPPELRGGSHAPENVPSEATLFYDIELIEIIAK